MTRAFAAFLIAFWVTYGLALLAGAEANASDRTRAEAATARKAVRAYGVEAPAVRCHRIGGRVFRCRFHGDDLTGGARARVFDRRVAVTLTWAIG